MMRFNEVVQEKLNRADSHGEISFLRYKPMLVPPRPWLSVDRGGFLSQKTVFMRTHGSQLQTESLYHADLHNIFKSLNTLSKVGWVVNKEVLRVAEQVWENGGGILDIPSRTDLPLPNRVSVFRKMSEIVRFFERAQVPQGADEDQAEELRPALTALRSGVQTRHRAGVSERRNALSSDSC